MLAVNIGLTLQPNVYPQNDPPIEYLIKHRNGDILIHISSAVREMLKNVQISYRKSIMRFPMRYRLAAYVTPNFQNGGSKTLLRTFLAEKVIFLIAIQLL